MEYVLFFISLSALLIVIFWWRYQKRKEAKAQLIEAEHPRKETGPPSKFSYLLGSEPSSYDHLSFEEIDKVESNSLFEKYNPKTDEHHNNEHHGHSHTDRHHEDEPEDKTIDLDDAMLASAIFGRKPPKKH